MNFKRTPQQSVSRLNDIYEDELGDCKLILRDVSEQLFRLSIVPKGERTWISDIGEAGTEAEMQAFMRGLELAHFNTIETKSKSPE